MGGRSAFLPCRSLLGSLLRCLHSRSFFLLRGRFLGFRLWCGSRRFLHNLFRCLLGALARQCRGQFLDNAVLGQPCAKPDMLLLCQLSQFNNSHGRKLKT